MVDELGDTDEKGQAPYLLLFLGELVGTAILMFVGCMGCVVAFPGGPIIPSFTFGFAVLAAIQVVGHISGCHINPAVSLGILLLGKIGLIEFIVYLAGQFLGALIGYAVLKNLMPNVDDICVLKLGDGITPMQAFFIEAAITFVLVAAVAGISDMKNKAKTDSSSLRVALTVSGLIFAAEPFTSAALNPARGVAPSLINNHWDHHWVFHAGPYLGAVVAAIVYRFIFDQSERFSVYRLIKRSN